MNKFSKIIHLSIFNCRISIRLNCANLSEILELVYGAMKCPNSEDNIRLSYIINRDAQSDEITISREGGPQYTTSDIGEFIFLFEKDMTIELQKIRADLLFIHSAVLEYKGQGLLLVAPSGTGKSTTSWAMINSGFKYLSDELAPLNLSSMLVEAYPHALCLKAQPPMFELPKQCLYTSATIHVPVNSMPVSAQLRSIKLTHIFYLEFDSSISAPVINSLSTAQASAKLFANSLNILAHAKGDKGLQAAVILAKQVNNYSLISSQLDKTCLGIKEVMDS